jgi:hypothetical protein
MKAAANARSLSAERLDLRQSRCLERVGLVEDSAERQETAKLMVNPC